MIIAFIIKRTCVLTEPRREGPQGETGADGVAGPQGETGPVGDQGQYYLLHLALHVQEVPFA